VTCRASSEGGAATRSVTVKRDTLAPYIAVLSPLEIAYPQGAWVPALFACADLRSGTKRCVGSTAPGARIDTGVAGPESFQVDATDQAGNSRRRVVNYRVR
jgi:hypothetical protein